jgi:hypothetical protein
MNEAIEDLLGNRVRVFSNGAANADEGILESFEYPWVRIRTKDDTILCFPVHNIRLLKLVERLLPYEPGETLLRPLEGNPEE